MESERANADEIQSPFSAHHMYDEMPSSYSTNKSVDYVERSDSTVLGLQNAANFSGVRKRKRGVYVAEKWDPIMKKRVWLGTFNTAEEASEAYLAKQCEFFSAHHMFDEMPSSNLTNKTAADADADDGKKPFIQEISFRDKSTLLGAEWHNMGKLRKKTFKKKQLCSLSIGSTGNNQLFVAYYTGCVPVVVYFLSTTYNGITSADKEHISHKFQSLLKSVKDLFCKVVIHSKLHIHNSIDVKEREEEQCETGSKTPKESKLLKEAHN